MSNRRGNREKYKSQNDYIVDDDFVRSEQDLTPNQQDEAGEYENPAYLSAQNFDTYQEIPPNLDEYVEHKEHAAAPPVYTPQPQTRGRSRRKNGIDISPTRIILWRVFSPILILAIAVSAVVIGVFIGGEIIYTDYFAPVSSESMAEEVTVEIKSGSSVSTIAQTLYEAGVIMNETTFKYYADFTDKSMHFQPGTYQLNTAMSFDDIIEELSKTVYIRGTLMITIPEGYTVEDMAEYFESLDLFGGSSEEFLELCRTGEGFEDYVFVNDAINANNVSEEKRRYVLEGYLFPDTYEIYADSSPATVITKMLDQFRFKFDSDLYTAAEKLGMTLEQVVTLASMIEREAKPADFEKVSAVFHNRLEEGQRLESCATLQFYTGEDKYVFDEEERAIDSLYNTYKYSGYPLGPISSPGELALDAAVNPDKEAMHEGYFYFCLGDPETGETIFSKTYEEHQAATDKYSPLWNAQSSSDSEAESENEDDEDA